VACSSSPRGTRRNLIPAVTTKPASHHASKSTQTNPAIHPIQGQARSEEVLCASFVFSWVRCGPLPDLDVGVPVKVRSHQERPKPERCRSGFPRRSPGELAQKWQLLVIQVMASAAPCRRSAD